MVLNADMSDHDLEQQIEKTLQNVDQSLVSDFWDAFNPLIPFLVIAATEGATVYLGRKTVEDSFADFKDRGKRVLTAKTAAALVYVIDGGWLSIPAGFAAGLWYDRMKNQVALRTIYDSNINKLRHFRNYQKIRLLTMGAA